MRRLRWILVAVLIVLVAGAAVAALWGRAALRGSLAQLDGQTSIHGLASPVEVTRDALGIPTIRGANRLDVARATGFLHAQERFFQMDLARRRAAGELAALVGPRAVIVDRQIRIHRFRAEAQRAVSLMSADTRAIVGAYTEGVNAGLNSLSAPPGEYLVLRQTPQPWKAEDTILVVLSMFVTLQDTDGEYESTLATMHEVLPPAVSAFLTPRGSEWDAPIVGPQFEAPPIPGPEVYNLREKRAGKPELAVPESLRPTFERVTLGFGIRDLGFDGAHAGDDALGSNNFAVSGRLTANGGALVANDMHLAIRVPNTWYRASLEWSDPSATSTPHRVTGVTLPGVPAVVAGSNTLVAWGFTNTYADWSDIVLLDVDPSNPNRYMTPGGWQEFERHDEVIEVAGGPSETETVVWTTWGPVLPPDYRGRARAYRWVAHGAGMLALSATPLESATTLEEAMDEANGLGVPGQNIVIADRSGRVGWSIYGSIPRRRGFDGQLPVSWSSGTTGWDGWLSDPEYPRIVDPPGGRVWSANARVVDGDMLAKLGDGSYEIGSRATIIRDRLAAQERFAPRDLLSIQLDANAEFLSRWRDLLLRALTPEAINGRPQRRALREILDHDWSGAAAPDSAAYRLTRSFREQLSLHVITFVLAECYEADPAFDYTTVRRREAAIWKLVTEQPQHLLAPQYATWSELILSTVDETIEQAMRNRSGDLRNRTWSEYNAITYRHPLSAAIPFGSRWLDMPSVPLAGDLYTPQVHWGMVGASERMIVSPGRESEGIMHMPTGQSGHPLSPFYANSHAAWVNGEPTPFLPGPTIHTLRLVP